MFDRGDRNASWSVAKCTNPQYHMPIIEALFGRYISLPFDDSAAQTHARIRVDLEQQGLAIGPYDMMIAAHRANAWCDIGHAQRS